MKNKFNLAFNIISFLILFTAPLFVQAENFETVYGRKANAETLRHMLVITDLKEVVREMQKSKLTIYKVLDQSSDSTSKTKHFSFLPEVPQHLKESLSAQIAEVSSESAIFVSWNEMGLNATNVLLLSETAKPTTLFHEFGHHLFEIQNRQDTLRISQEQKDVAEFLRIYNRRIGSALLDDSSFRLRHWREGFDSNVDQYSLTFDGVQGQLKSEEVAIETGLIKLMLEVKSPHFSLARAEEGLLQYCERAIVQGTESQIGGATAFLDKIRQTGKIIGEDWTIEEDQIREKHHAAIIKRFDDYKNGSLRKLKIQIEEAKKLLRP